MLRNRSRAVSKKQGIMADHSSQPSSPNTQNHTKLPIPSFFGSPRFAAFTVKNNMSETDHAMMSPTSILDTKPFSPYKNPFSYDTNQSPKSPKIFSHGKTGIGLALLHTLNNDQIGEPPLKGKVLFSAKLSVQIPSSASSPFSPTGSAANSSNIQGSNNSPQVVTGFISVKEMKLLEEYTCVISHGPNPRTTHIFDNFIVEGNYGVSEKANPSVSKSFLSFCHTCKKDLEQKNDIYIYRGEKAFCSHECRYQEILMDEEVLEISE